MKKILLPCCLILLASRAIAQHLPNENIGHFTTSHSIKQTGLSLLDTRSKQFFFLGESRHGMRQTPSVMLTLLKHLNKTANTRILALEHGYSVAYMLNKYLATKDSVLLREISKNSMLWGKENYTFIQDLAVYNDQLPSDQKIIVRSIDIEFKAEPAVFVINEFIGNRTIPMILQKTLGEFKKIFDEKNVHRQSFDGLNIFHYYDRKRMVAMITDTYLDYQINKTIYSEFFGSNATHFDRIIQDLYAGYVRFNARRPNANFKFRDDIIYQRFVDLMNGYPTTGILCTIGAAHLKPKSSGSRSPVKDQSLTIVVHGDLKGRILNRKLRNLNSYLDGALSKNDFTLIRHADNVKRFKSSFAQCNYSIFMRDGKELTPFEKSFTGK
jgi:hypothetical protein